MRQTIFTVLLLVPLLLHAVEIRDLRCEYQEKPLGIDAVKPRLSWKIENGNLKLETLPRGDAAPSSSEVRGQRQTAYQVLVASLPELLAKDKGDLWDSGKVASDQSILVEYAGKPLESRMRCYWKVRVWTTATLNPEPRTLPPSSWSSPALWTMGLLKPDDWQAQWITAPLAPVSNDEMDKTTVVKAAYRTLDGLISVDVTEIMRKELAKKEPFEVHFKKLGGDPAPNVQKELVVEYVMNGKPGTARAVDFQTLRLSGNPGKSAPWIRKEFALSAKPDSAYVTVHSPGYFEVYMNGAKVGHDVLTPAVSNLKHQSFTVTYDVSRYLHPGQNCIGLWLGEGWADGIAVRAQLDAVVAGKAVMIGTDTSWNTRSSGLYRIGGKKWNDFGGERLDARESIPDWNVTGLDTAAWRPAALAASPSPAVRSQPCPLNRIGKVIPAMAVTALEGGRYEIDFGTALTGWLRLKMPVLQAGTIVRMTSADVRRDKKYQDFKQVSEFVSGGKAGEVFENKFNYAGFQYVVIEGLPSAPAKEDATALLIESELEEVGAFECSNELFNRIHSVNQWTQRSLNLGGYYVDCPHRERMGYGDGQVAAEGFMTSFRADGFYRKWLRDWRLRQEANGNLPHMAPFGSGGGGPGWGGLLSAITWRHYLYYGDRSVLEENYDAVRRYVDYLESICKEGVLRKFGGQWDFIGDWVPPERGMDTKNWPGAEAAELFNNCYRIKQMELLTQMAAALGKPDDVERYNKRLAEIRPIVHAAYYDTTKQEYVIDEQAYYIMPLMTGVVPEALRSIIIKKLEQNILVKNNGHLDTGMLGTYFMMETLRELGRNDLVFTMFNQTTYPGWGHMLAEGATTLWEQWNGHWSRIHSCFTSPDNWLYQGPAGILADSVAPGFKKVIIKPAIVGDLTWVKAHHDSPYGRIVSDWKREGGVLTLNVIIPVNTSATVYVPAKDAASVTESGKPADKAEGVKFLRMESGVAVFEVTSGAYQFQSKEYSLEKSYEKAK
jgi:alpha-L-rhamnosidase